MTKKSADATKSDFRPILPLPAIVTQHHLGTPAAPSALAQSMREWRDGRRVPPSLLLTGVPGSAKRELAHWIAQWIFCERTGFGTAASVSLSPSPSEDEGPGLFGAAPEAAPAASGQVDRDDGPPAPCGACHACDKALKGAWVDFQEIRPEEEGGALKVDQFRKLKASLGFGAHEGAYRIILIPDADHMTVQAANSLLKVLEEPPPGWLFFLTASDPTLVLPTILSRCQQLRLRPFSAAEIEALLQEEGVEPKRAAVSARLGQGSLSKSRSLASEEVWKTRQSFFEFLKAPESQLTALVDWAAAEPAHFELLIDQLELLALDLILNALHGPTGHAWLNPDGQAALTQHAQRVTRKLGSAAAARDFWSQRADRLARGRTEAQAPLNRKLLAQDLLLPWLSA